MNIREDNMALEQDLDEFLFFDGEMPNLADGVEEVPYPQGFEECND